MADYKVEITKYAESSMRAISHYIEFELRSPQAAKNTLQKISKGIFSLDTFPERFSLTEEEPWRTEGVRKMLIGNFFVYYWIDKDNHIVRVVDVIYALRKQKNALNDVPKNT